MKKLIQISLVVVFVFVLLLGIAGTSNVSADQSISAMSNASSQGAQVAVCVGIKTLNCAVPNVGWNS